MAAWQYSFFVIPAHRVRLPSNTGVVPLTMSLKQYDRLDWWEGIALPTNFRGELDALLPRNSSENDELERWGSDDGNRIHILNENGRCVNIQVRVDLRAISVSFLANVLNLIAINKWMLLTQDQHLLLPNVTTLMRLIEKSRAFRFVENPAEFLNWLRDHPVKEEP